MGDKAAARRLAATLGVPTLAGLRRRRPVRRGADAARPHGSATRSSSSRRPAAAARACAPSATPDRAAASARRRPSRGAGGVRRRPADPRAARRGRRATSRSRSCSMPHGNGVHLGERDCSIQRRHQKVLEESAVAGGRRARSDGASATRPCALAARGRLRRAPAPASSCSTTAASSTFLEMNTRLQVEHPVTEARHRAATSSPTSSGSPPASRSAFDQADVRLDGHAIEVRLYAEDAEARLPAGDRADRAPALAGRRRHPGRRRRRRGRRGRRPLRPDARQDHRPRRATAPRRSTA